MSSSPIPSRGAPTRDNPPLMKAMLEALEPFFETTGPHCDAAYAAYQAAALFPVEAANGSGWRPREDDLVSALKSIAEGNLGDMPWQANYETVKQIARNAIAYRDASPPLAEGQDHE